MGGVYGGITEGPTDPVSWSPSPEYDPTANSIAASVELEASMSRICFRWFARVSGECIAASCDPKLEFLFGVGQSDPKLDFRFGEARAIDD
mmetsp:Transcript_16789/g.48239  ORF Transcript_16789/g.48239 Transcript_16789/m.48239 type:complete len:91 (+) Transcript_16789:1266-1538(+)